MNYSEPAISHAMQTQSQVGRRAAAKNRLHGNGAGVAELVREAKPLLVFLLAALVIPSPAGAGLFVALNLWTLFATPLQMVKILTIQFVLISLNGELFNQPASFGLHLMTPFMVLASMLLRHRVLVSRFRPPLLQRYLLLSAALLVLNIASSTYPAISVFKIIAFAVYTAALLQVMEVAWWQAPGAVRNWIVAVVVVTVVSSFPLLFTPLGFTRNSTGFNGILFHPQTFGLVLAAGVSYLLGILITERRLSGLYLAIAAVGVAELVRTESRGAIFSCFLAVGGWVAWEAVIQGRIKRIVFTRIMAAVFLLVSAVVVKHESAIALWDYVVSKSGRAGNVGLGEAYFESRGNFSLEQLKTFSRHPISGVGFQVEGSRKFASSIIYDPVTGVIPVSASVEKGNLYTAILEEGGVFGGLAMYTLVLLIVVPALRGPTRPEKVLVLVVLMSNISEATFFSTTGVGGWNWQMLALAYASRVRRGTA